jgi:hypothetical protein
MEVNRPGGGWPPPVSAAADSAAARPSPSHLVGGVAVTFPEFPDSLFPSNHKSRGILPGPPLILLRATCFRWPEKLALIILWSHANQDGWCWPSLSLLAAEMGCSRQVVQQALRTLVRMGLITCERRQGRSTLYRVFPEAVIRFITQSGSLLGTQSGSLLTPSQDPDWHLVRILTNTQSGSLLRRISKKDKQVSIGRGSETDSEPCQRQKQRGKTNGDSIEGLKAFR